MALPYEVADMCRKCITSHIAKKGEFKVSCKPLPKSLEDPNNPFYPFDKVMGVEAYNALEPEDKISMQLKVNKLLWAKEYLNWSVYNSERDFDQYYQREMLNCNAKLRTMRLGRRMGKTEVVTVDALHFAQNNPGKTVMIIGPFQNLIDEIFDRLAALLDSDESAFTGGYERKRQPNVIRLPNGSQIKGFTTGLNGDSIRGQSADRIYFDEAAYIPPTAFRAVLALLMDNPNVSITATSTPSALQTNFKKWCLEDPEWREFHYQSTLFPYFHEIEGTLRSTYTGDDFSLEVLAEFIEGSSRIFKSHNINTAAKEYNYITRFDQLEGEERKDWIITIGVDYNEYKNGVQLVVLGFNKRTQHFRVLNRVSLHNETYGEDPTKNLQTTGVNLIKDQYQSFQADYVYVDQGHGSMQNEVLAKWFFEIGKPHVFKGVDFASNYEYEDIYTGEIKHKRKKVMMVYFLQKRFELGEIDYSVNEEKEKGLMTDQLNDYRVDRYDSKDQPIFAGHDHILDGLMLANFAIIENFTALFDIKTGLYVGTIERNVERFVDKEFKDIKYNKPERPWELDPAAITNGYSGTSVIKKGRRRKRGLTDEFGIF
ncbi:MAG: terminase large subunit domain-containing protein [Paraclostridium sp.]